ncbi:MAG: diaminopimelate decarboxylase [Polyangiaceae bacterium]|nr:diaminopimelate decarboxylase [Polyangiaceae bacterium]
MADPAPPFGFHRDALGRACLGGAPLSELLAASGLETPAYVYDLDAIQDATSRLVSALGPGNLVAYAVKANSAGSVVRAVAEAGAGADLVSGGELQVALACGITPERIVMSGVAKSDAELDRAISLGLCAIQVESVEELPRVSARAAALGAVGRVSLRINPGVEIDSHAHIATGHDEAKFGILEQDLPAALEILRREASLSLVGVSTHVGSMLREPEPYLESARVVCQVALHCRASGHPLEFVDFGGGFGIDYGGEPADAPEVFARAALGLLAEWGLADLRLVVEPGRALVGPYGVLLTRAIQTKRSGGRHTLMIDAGMNDLIRPALYAAKHRVEPCDALPGALPFRVVGPVCESSDDFGEHPLGDAPSGLFVVRDAGAYGFTMASEYNGRALPGEISVRAGRVVKAAPSPGVAAWVTRRLEA